MQTNQPSQTSEARLSGEFISAFGTDTGNFTGKSAVPQSGTDAVSQIFAEGGFSAHGKSRALLLSGIGLILAAAALLLWGSEDLPQATGDTLPSATTQFGVSSVGSDPLLQEDLKLMCQPVSIKTSGEQRYGCNSYFLNGEYNGLILGWWQVVDIAGQRIPVYDLSFRSDGYDTTFALRTKQSQAKVEVIPWLR